MRFVVFPEVFELLPTACFGVVVARGLDNSGTGNEIGRLLEERMEETRQRFAQGRVKEDPYILPYREAFTRLGINPNKFMSSIEAMVTRIAKGGTIPRINDAVDLVNAVSLKHVLPMGAHDLSRLKGDICVRLTSGHERFVPLGQGDPEPVEPGEMVYADDAEVRTRRWIWRQGDGAKVTRDSSHVFFPIDGFTEFNKAAVLSARDELAELAEKLLGCRVSCYYLDREQPSAILI